MALTQTLQEMVANLRAEAGHSRDILQGVNTELTLKYIIKRTQEELWTAFVWPELVTRVHLSMAGGTYLYQYPLPTMTFDNIRATWVADSFTDSSWTRVAYGFPSEDFILPDFSNSKTADPVEYWQPEDSMTGGHFRVWPTPATNNCRLRFVGQQSLQPLIANSDKCTLDATLIILFSASELLARSKAEDAPNKLQKAQRHLTKLLGNQVSAKNKVSTYGTSASSGSYRPTIVAGYP